MEGAFWLGFLAGAAVSAVLLLGVIGALLARSLPLDEPFAGGKH